MAKAAGFSIVQADLDLDRSNPLVLLTRTRHDYEPNILRLSACPYLAYNALALLADHVFDLPTDMPAQHNHPVPFTGDVRHVRSGDFVFVKIDLLWDFCKTQLPWIVCPFYLLVGHSDNPVDVDRVFAADKLDRILCLVSTNAIGDHPRMMRWPIGFREFGRETARHLIVHCLPVSEEGKQARSSLPPNALSLTYHDPNTNVERATQIRALAARGDVVMFGRCHPAEYFQQLRSSVATICLPGRGWDTHRVYEALLLGCRPVVQAGHPLEALYTSLGCAVVPDVVRCQVPAPLTATQREKVRGLLLLDELYVRAFVTDLIHDYSKRT
jgi:hypothetical protein